MYKKQPPSWSLSKHRMLKECELKVALNYYLAKRGEFKDSPLNLQLAWRLKHLKNVFMLFGEVFHEMVEREINTLLETGEVLSESKMTSDLSISFKENYDKAEKELQEWYQDPKGNTLLYELYYEGGLSNKVNRLIEERSKASVNGFLNSSTLQNLIIKGNITLMEAEKFRSIYVDDVRVVLSADLIYFDKENDLYGIVDWKTGKESEHNHLQLALYAMYLEAKYGADLSNIIVTNEFIEKGTNKSYIINKEDTDKLKKIIIEDAKRITYLEEKLFKNEKEEIDRLKRTEDRATCERCNFKGICLDQYKEIHLNKFRKEMKMLQGVGKVTNKDVVAKREWVNSGTPILDEYRDWAEESPYETEESYRSKLETMSDWF